MRLIDRTGERFGRLVVMGRYLDGERHTKWRCRCDCGNATTAHADALVAGATRSCGCLAREMLVSRSLKHGHAVNYRESPEFKAWSKAKSRCYNTNDAKYENYGGRGIRMCNEWINDFAAFLRDMGLRPSGKTLDRVDVNGNYEPSNCRWATPTQQARNRTDNVYVEYNGARVVLKEAAVQAAVPYKALHRKVRIEGYDIHAAIDHIRRSRQYRSADGGPRQQSSE